MRYLGSLRGTGMVMGGSGPLGRADYDLDAYQLKPGEVVASGEIRMQAAALNDAFGRRDLSLQTDDGRTLSLHFSGKRLNSSSTAAHADVRGGLPDAENWSR